MLAGEAVERCFLVQDGITNLVKIHKCVDANIAAKCPALALRGVQLSGKNLVISGVTLGPVEGKLNFGQNAGFKRIWLEMDELTATLLLQEINSA